MENEIEKIIDNDNTSKVETVKSQAGDKEQKQKKLLKKLPIKWLIIILIIIIFLFGIIFGTLKLLKKISHNKKEKTDEKEDIYKVKNYSDFSLIYPLKPFIVTINEKDLKLLLKANVELEVLEESTKNEVKANLPKIRDAILISLSTKTWEAIQDIKGKIELKNELILKINKILKNGKIRDLYFTEILAQ